MAQDDPAVAPEVAPLIDFLRKLSDDMRANGALDQELVAILDNQLVSVEPDKKAGAAVADAIERLAVQRAEADHA